MIKRITPSSHEEWLKIRTNGIGSSEVAAACGLSGYTSPLQYWKRKMAERNGESVEFRNIYTEFGHWLEGGVASAFSAMSGHKVIASSSEEFMIANDERPYMIVSPDRTYWIDENAAHNEANKGILECKTTNLKLEDENEQLVKIHGYKLTKELQIEECELHIPISWYCQVQYQLYVCGKKHGALAYMRLASRDTGYCYIDCDKDFCADMVRDLDAMWGCLEKGLEPLAVTVEDAADKWPEHNPETEKSANIDIVGKWERIKELDTQIKVLDKERAAIASDLKVYCEDYERVTYDGEPLYTYKKSADRRVFDDKRFQLEHPDLYGKYLKDRKGSRTLLIK